MIVEKKKKIGDIIKERGVNGFQEVEVKCEKKNILEGQRFLPSTNSKVITGS